MDSMLVARWLRAVMAVAFVSPHKNTLSIHPNVTQLWFTRVHLMALKFWTVA